MEFSGDYGSGYYGYAVNTSTFLTKHEEFGWLAFGGNIQENGDVLEVEITTAAKSRIYIAPLKLWMTMDAGKFKKITYNKSTKDLGIELAEANEFTPNAYLRIESFGKPVFENKTCKVHQKQQGAICNSIAKWFFKNTIVSTSWVKVMDILKK